MFSGAGGIIMDTVVITRNAQSQIHRSTRQMGLTTDSGAIGANHLFALKHIYFIKIQRTKRINRGQKCVKQIMGIGIYNIWNHV